jgi:hypothetical protein
MPRTTTARRVNTRIEAHTYRTRIVTPRIERTPPRQAYKQYLASSSCDCSRPTNFATSRGRMLGLASHRGQSEKSPDAEHGAIVYGNEAMLPLHPQRGTDLAECCGADTPPASLSNVSRSRPTTDQHHCFVAARLMQILRKRSAHVGPGALPHTPLRAPGPAATSTEIPGPVAEGGTGRRNKTPIPPLGGTTKGTEVTCGCPHRVEPHAEDITHGRSGIPWAEKWPSIGIIAVVLQSGQWG